MKKEYWDEFFKELDSMSSEDFKKLLEKLDKSPDIPFCVDDYIAAGISDEDHSDEDHPNEDHPNEDHSNEGDVTKNE